ncbi:MAG: hypothetical protein R2752_23410 [Vicinamibacterales bacterium]
MAGVTRTGAVIAVLAEMYGVVVQVATLNRSYPRRRRELPARLPQPVVLLGRRGVSRQVHGLGRRRGVPVVTAAAGIALDTGDVAITREGARRLIAASDWLEFDHLDGTPVESSMHRLIEGLAAPPG